MEDMFLKQAYNMVVEFIKLYNINDYISKSMLDGFYDKYSDIIELSSKYNYENNETYKRFISIIKNGYLMINIKNNKYIDEQLKINKEYFDNMFKSIDPNILLDDEQRKAILVDEDYSLVIAGAGSGKTTTMVAKVKYLIEKKHVDPKTIILLSFTNKSVDDLNDILNNKFRLNIEVLTFHKLGMKFLRNIYQDKLRIIDDSGQFQVLSEYFINYVFKDKKLLSKYMKVFDKYLYLEDDCLKYDNYDDYYNNYIDLKYEECKNDLTKEINKRVLGRERIFETINGEIVKSKGEVKIANYLYKNGIDYEYEGLYPYLVGDKRTYKPDFIVNDFDHQVYVEYYGLAILKNNGEIDSYDKNYVDEIYKKRKTHLANNTDLIELYGRYEKYETYLNVISKELEKRNVVRKQRTEKEIFYRLLETAKRAKYRKLIQLVTFFIKNFKENNCLLSDFDILINSTNDDILKGQLECIKDMYIYYQTQNRINKRIDFEDMIHYAYIDMEKLKYKGSRINYDYVIIDEYQDISYQRFNFTKKISDLFKAKIVAVGDDWQTIYSFSGSDIELFRRFDEIMGYSECIKITKTYRNCQELIDVAGEFVLKDSYHIEKYLKSDKHLDLPIKLVEYDYEKEELPNKLNDLIIEIYNKHPNDNILLLVRFNDELNDLLESNLFIKPYLTKDGLVCKSVPNAKIDLLTVHKSKGLGYDRVILLNGIEGTHGFPSQIQDELIINYLKEMLDEEPNNSNVMYPEERRLFYVALTRTKNELYILTPNDYNYRSSFVREIENHENVGIVSE